MIEIWENSYLKMVIRLLGLDYTFTQIDSPTYVSKKITIDDKFINVINDRLQYINDENVINISAYLDDTQYQNKYLPLMEVENYNYSISDLFKKNVLLIHEVNSDLYYDLSFIENLIQSNFGVQISKFDGNKFFAYDKKRFDNIPLKQKYVDSGYNLRSNQFSVLPSHEFFMLTHEDLLSANDILGSIRTSLLNPIANIMVHLKDYSQFKILDELSIVGDITSINNDLFSIKPKKNLNEICSSINLNNYTTYLLNDEYPTFNNYTEFIDYLKD